MSPHDAVTRHDPPEELQDDRTIGFVFGFVLVFVLLLVRSTAFPGCVSRMFERLCIIAGGIASRR